MGFSTSFGPTSNEARESRAASPCRTRLRHRIEHVARAPIRDSSIRRLRVLRLVQGEDSEPAQESIRCLASTELRAALRRWYLSFDSTELNPTATEFRIRLSEMVGEAL